MTAEIAILNKEAAVLAADSAITLDLGDNKKIFVSANKIFALSKYYPVAIMIYGNAQFMDIPWELIIKLYRAKIKDRNFDFLFDFAEDFLDFLLDLEIDKKVEKKHFKEKLEAYLETILTDFKNSVTIKLEEGKKLTEEDILSILEDVINQDYERWEKQSDSYRTKNINQNV